MDVRQASRENRLYEDASSFLWWHHTYSSKDHSPERLEKGGGHGYRTIWFSALTREAVSSLLENPQTRIEAVRSSY